MAVKYQEIIDKLENGPLTQSELKVIDDIEKYIDKQIEGRFSGDYISLEPRVIEFNYDPTGNYGSFSGIKSPRKKLMTIELKRRFEEAGWKWKLEEGEDDGPNRPAMDYWHLKGK